LNAISEFIIRLLSPKPKKGQVLIMPYLTKDKTGIPNPRKVSPPDNSEAVVSTATASPLPGQIPLDAVLPEMGEVTHLTQIDTANVNKQGILTVDE
jgi:hypothetical protein